MSDGSQVHVPPSFSALYTRPGRLRPDLPFAELAARHELCEDLATLLTERAADEQWASGAEPLAVLQRMHRGLMAASGPAVAKAPLTPAEAGWVVKRLAELLGWPLPADEDLGPAGAG